MKGKFKGKIFNFRNIIISLIIAVMVAISGISIVQYNNNVNTNLSEAKNSDYPIKGSDLVNAALKYLGRPGSEIDCSGLINKAIIDCGGADIKGGSSAGWNNHWFTYNFKDTTFEPKEIASYTDENGKKTTWYSKIANVDELPIGTIVSGHGDGNTSGHVFIYIGKASTYEELQANIKTQYNIDLPTNNGDKSKFDIRGKNDSTGGQYWYIEGNTVEHVRIRNFNWNVKDDNAVKNMKYIKVWKITENDSPSSYSIRLIKNNGIGDAKFVTLHKVNNAYSDTTTTITKAGTYETVTGLNNMNEKGDITVDKNGVDVLDVYKIYESDSPKDYKNDWKDGVYIGVKKACINNQYQVEKIAISKTEADVTNVNSGKWMSVTGNTQVKEPISGLTVNFHGIGNTSDGKYNKFGVIALYFNDTKETPKFNNYNVSITKVDENGNVIPNASFESSYFYEEPANTFDEFAQKDNYIIDMDIYNVNDYYIHQKNNFSVNSGESIVNNVTIGSGTKNGSVGSSFTLGANAAIMVAQRENKKLIFSPQDHTEVIESHIAIKDSYSFSENKVNGYVQDTKQYTLEIEKYYDQQYSMHANDGYTYWGRISKVTLSDGTNSISKEFEYSNNKIINPNLNIAIGNATVNIDIATNGGANIDIKLKNKPVEGSYEIYYGKKSQYEDLSGYTNSTEINGTKNLKGANFTVKKYLDGNLDMENPDEVINVTSEGNKWEYFTVNTKSLQTDRFRIIEDLPPSQYAEGIASQIWIDVYKKETENKIEVDHTEISFRDKNGNFVRKDENGKETEYYYNSNNNLIGNCANGWFQFEKPNGVFKAIFVFQNPKKYGLQIVKKDVNGEIISSDKGNANFSIKMFTKFSKNEKNNTINIDGLQKIKSSEFGDNYERKDAITENLDTVDGVLNLSNWIVEESMLGNTYYYLVTENVSPIGYNSIGSLIIGIHFDADGNSSIESMYHVSGSNGSTFNIEDSAEGKESLSVKVGEDVNATANDSQEITGRIDLSIQQPTTKESDYNLLLEKKDASNGNNLSGVNFEISNIKINNTDINVPGTYSITSNGSANNIINEIYTHTNDAGKNAIGNEEKVINKYENTDTYTVKETNNTSGYELNNIVTKINFYKKTVDGNIKNNYTGVTFDNKSEKTVNDGYFISSLDENNVSSDDRKISNLQNYINTIQNESAVIVYYANGRIVVQYYNKLEGTYSLNLKKKIKSSKGVITDTIDSSIKFNIKLYKTKSANNEFSDEVTTVNNKEDEVVLTNLTNAQSITSSLQNILITKNDENKTYYYVLDETETRKDLIKLDYKIVVPVKFEKDSTTKKYVAKLDGNAFGLKESDNSKIELDDSVSVDVNNSTINIVGINKQKTGKYNLQVLKINKNIYSDYETIDAAFKNGTLYEHGMANAVIGIRESRKNGEILNTTETKITTENKKATQVYDNSIEISNEDFIEDTNLAILQYSAREITSPDEFKLNTISSEIIVKLENEDYKYSINEAYISGISVKKAYEENGVYVNIDQKNETPTIVFVIADTPITGSFSFNMKKINKNTEKELTEEEKNGMKFNFKLYTGGQSFDNPGTQVTQLTKNDGSNIDISNLTTIDEINSAMGNIEITNDMVQKNNYKLIIEETTSPSGFLKFDHKIGIDLYVEESNEQYVMKSKSVMIKNGNEWQSIYGTYNSENNTFENVWTDEKVSFNKEDNTLTFTLPNTPKTGNYDLQITKVDISGNVIKNEKTKFNVKMYTNEGINNAGNIGYAKDADKEYPDLYATTGVTTGIKDEIKQEYIGKTYYYMITEETPPDEFTKIDYKIMVPVTFSENENGYVATKGEPYALVENTSLDQSGSINWYIKKSLSDVATSTTDVVTTEQTDATINVNVPNKRNYTLKLKKTNASTGEGLANVGFNLIGAKINGTALKNANNQDVTKTTAEPITTDTNGTANICEQTSVPNPIYISTTDADEYYITETSVPGEFEKLPDDLAIKLQVNKSTNGEITAVWLGIVNSSNIQDTKKLGYVGETSTVTYTLDSGSTVTISATISNNEVVLTVADPTENTSGEYNLYLEKRSNKNERLAGVNFELIDGLVNGAKITQNNAQISEQNAKTIVTGNGKTDVYTNPINIENTTTDTFTLREKDLGNNKGYTQLPSDYKIKVEITKEKVGSEFRSKNVTLKLLDKSGNEVSKNENGKYVINNVEYDIRIEKSGNIIRIIVENPKVEGEYKLNVIKKNVKDTGNVTSFNSFGTNSIAGAKIKATVYKGTTVNNYNFNFWDSTNRVVFDEYTTKGTTEDLTHDNFKRTGITYFDIANQMLDIWDIEETDAPEGFENMKKSLVLGIEKAYNDTTKQFSILDIHIYKRDNSSIRWDAQSYNETNLADGSVLYEYVSDENDTWHIMLNKERTQIAVAACNIPQGDYKLNIMKKDTTSESAGDVYNDSIANATFDTVLYKDIEFNSADFKFGRRYNSGNYETFASRNGGSSNYVTKGTEEDLNNDIFKRENITTDSIGNKYDIWKIYELMPPDGLEGYMTNLVLGVKKEYDTGSKKFKIKSITMYKDEDGTIAKDENGNWKAETVYNLYENGGMKTPVTEMTEHTTYVYFDKDNTRRWDLVIDSNNNKIIVTLHNDLEGNYNLNIVKKGAADSTVRLNGYKFAVKKATDGNAEKDLYTEESPLTTSYLAPSYVDSTKIHRESLNTPDVYTFTELDTPENSGYVKIPYKFKLTISKKIAKNDKGINQYLVDKMKLELIDENGNVVKQGTSDSDNKVVIESTLNGQTYSVIVELVNNTISITVINPEKSGTYSLNLRKLDEETKAVLDGAEFSVKLYNAMTYGTNEKTSVDVLKDDGSRETIDLTKIKTVKDFEKLKNIIIEDPSGITYHTWEIIETKAPEGYQKLNYSITINLMQADTTNGKTMSIIFTPNARYEDGTVKKLKDLDDDEVKTTVSANSDENTNLTTVSIDMYNRKTEIEGQYDLNIKKVSKSGVELNNVEFSLMSAKINNAVVTNDKGESATDERFVTGSNGVANIPSLTSVPNPIKITDIENDDVYVFRETALPDYAKNKYVKLPDYVSIELTVKKASKEIDGKNQFVANSVSIKLIDSRDKKEYKGSRNNVISYSFIDGGELYTATISASIVDNTVTLTIENPERTTKGEYKLSLIKMGDNERLGGVKFNLISARFNGNTIQNGNSVVSESNPVEITTNAQKEVGIWPTDGSLLKISKVTSDEFILKEVDLGNNSKYVKLPDNKLIKLVVLKEETNNEFKVSSINMYVGNDTDGWQSATYTVNEEHTMIIEATITVTDNAGNEFALSFSRSGNNLTLTVEDPKEETTKYTVSKKWDDPNSTESRPEYVEFRLFGFKKDDTEAQKIYRELNKYLDNKEYSMVSSRIKEIESYKYYEDINVRASDGWQDATWYNLSKDYDYFAWEVNLADGYEIKDADVSADNTKLTITNYKAPTKYTVQKVWDDENVTGSRPQSVDFKLYSFNKNNTEKVKLYNELMGYVKDKNYSKISQRIKDDDIVSSQLRGSISVTAANNWTATFDSLSSDYYYFAWEVSNIDGYNITDAEISDNNTKIKITNSEDSGRYKVFLMKKNVAEAKTAYGDDTRSALAGAEFSTKVYKNIRKNNMNFEFNNSFNEEDKGTYTTIGTDANGETDLIDANGIVRSGLKSNELNTGDMYDIWKIEETKSPDGFSLMTEPLVFGVKKKYDSTTKEFSIEDIFVYTKKSNGIASSLGGAWTITPITNQNGNTANGINPVVENTTYTFEQNGNTWSIVLSKDKTKIILTAYDKKISKFNYKLIKKEQGSDKSLSGALFETTIKDEDGNPLRTSNGKEINKLQQRTSAEYGTIDIDDIEIDGEGKKYTVEITEVIAPAGYEKIMDTITFTVTSQLSSDGSYILTPGDYTVENTKECKVDENGDLIVTVEDKKTEKKEFAVYKEWGNVKDTELPKSITVELYQVPENELDKWNELKNDKVKRQEYLYRGYLGSGGTVELTKDNAITSDGLTWYYKWSNLAIENNSTKDKNIYYVIETEGPEGFITTMEPSDYTDPDTSSVTIKNTKPTTKYTIQKVWDENVQISAMPRTLLVSLYAFDKNNENDVKTYNDLVEYVNNKNYDEINKKLETLTDKKQGNSIGLSAGNQWSFTWNSLSTDNYYFAWESDSNALSKFNITNAVISDENTKMTITNTQPEGSFNFKLIKKLENTNITLANAKFTLSIKDEDGNELIPDTSHEYKTDANGEINLNKLAITSANKEYTVTIKETEAPAGYVKLTDEVSFKVKSVAKADGSGYELAENDLTQIKNAKDANVTAEGIEVTIYNDLTPPHKGVKDIKNQDSGYYDSVTGKVYANKDEAISTLHDWVIQTTIPEGITAYTTYEISDEINEKLVFAGLDTVKVKYVNGAELTKDKDYKVTYDEASRMLKVTFLDESFKGGYNLEVGKDVEIRFNTTFALDSDGNIIAINEEVPNQAKLTYGNDVKQTKLTEIPEVHTGGVGIYKYDEKTKKALEGAHFKIATSKENAMAGVFVKDGNGNDIEKVTNSKGVAEFAGLEFGEDALNKAQYETRDSITGAKVYKYDISTLSTTYYLVETESPKGYLKLEEPIEVVVKVGSYDMKDITSLVQVGNEEGIYDLSLRKFITNVKDTAKGTEEEVTSRIPQVDLTKLASGESTTATYTHPKDPVLVHTTDIVTYTIRIYNEGPQDAYASIVKDDIPDGLQFVQYTEGDGSLNAQYRWKLVDENDNEVTDVSKAKYIVTDYLSKEQDKTPGANLLKAYKPETMSELDYRDVKVQFRVTEPTTSDRILINYAQISKETDSSGRIVRDRDSTPNVWVEGEDDQDIEKVRVQYFDLALRKWVTQAIVTENGKTVVTQTGHKAEDDPEEVVKVDLKKSKINNVVVKFRYSIRITNEGEIAGEATEIRDDIPQGLKFVAEDNPDWREENGQIVTNKLEHTTLQPGESAEVEILLTWINSENNMGVMINVAEINKDHNDYGAPDIDSTPGNNVPGEDDIDDAPVMLTVKTGSEYILYVGIALSAIAVIAVGGKVIKKKVMRNI